MSNKAIKMDHELLMQQIDTLSQQEPSVSVTGLGSSIFGRMIPMVTLGEGKKAVLYVGAHHGMEWITSSILLRFIRDFCDLLRQKGRVSCYQVDYLYHTYTFYIIPMLNPDGVAYQQHGVSKENILYSRLLSMNDGSEDFSGWQANARGVDLNHNYAAGFEAYKKLELENGILGGAPTRFSGEAPESEPEVGALCNFLRYNQAIQGVLTLHTQGEVIYYPHHTQGDSGGIDRIAKSLRQMTGYELLQAEGPAAYGGLSDWCAEELSLPSFTIECGKGRNPLPPNDEFPIYFRLRQALFAFPTFLPTHESPL